MEAHDYPLAHFNGMTRLAEALKSIPAQLLEHQYSYETFGSWAVAIRYMGQTSRFVFDGRDRHLAIQRSADRKPPYTYGAEQTVGEGVHFGEPDAAAIAAICRAVTSR